MTSNIDLHCYEVLPLYLTPIEFYFTEELDDYTDDHEAALALCDLFPDQSAPSVTLSAEQKESLDFMRTTTPEPTDERRRHQPIAVRDSPPPLTSVALSHHAIQDKKRKFTAMYIEALRNEEPELPQLAN